MILTEIDKEAVFQTVQAKVRRVPASYGDQAGLCLVWALGAVLELRKRGETAIIQAGTASWPLIEPADDDGVRPTHFSYTWEPGSHKSLQAILQGMLPEMHVWAAILRPRQEESEIVDLSASFFPEQAKRLCGFDWPGPKPPKYLWCRGTELPPGAVYQAELDACLLAHQAALGFHRESGL